MLVGNKMLKRSEVIELLDIQCELNRKIVRTEEEEHVRNWIYNIMCRWIAGEEARDAWEQKNTHTRN